MAPTRKTLARRISRSPFTVSKGSPKTSELFILIRAGQFETHDGHPRPFWCVRQKSRQRRDSPRGHGETQELVSRR